MSHSKGPWKWDGHWLSGNGKMILWYTTEDNGVHANPSDAHLIAAAPDLLSALNAMLTNMGMDEDEWNKPTFDQARAAIAKATGSN